MSERISDVYTYNCQAILQEQNEKLDEVSIRFCSLSVTLRLVVSLGSDCLLIM